MELEPAWIPLLLFDAKSWGARCDTLPSRWQAAARLAAFGGRPGQLALVTTPDGLMEAAIAGLEPGDAGNLSLRGLSSRLPGGDYTLQERPAGLSSRAASLAWSEGLYRFDRYRTQAQAAAAVARLVGEDEPGAAVIARACALARDLINTPANDLGPAELEAAARCLAERCGAQLTVVEGDALLQAGYPAVHAVGRAATSARAPRIVELTWGDPGLPLVAIIGKGVVFDTGGLDLKPSSGMRLMKKDMGGGAHALALGQMVIEADLPIRLAVIVPMVENAVSADAMRPGDVISTRKGLTVEVGNTDAEGRLILADALTRAAELQPVLTVDLATLTGAARVALGPQLPPFYTDDNVLAAELEKAAERVGDPIWRMPLWSRYAAALDSDIADLKNDPDAWAQAGSITAALFLKRFAPAGPWAHFDIFGWNPRARPGWPVGGEAQAIRAIFAMLEERFVR